jgi:hypothetical protein
LEVTQNPTQSWLARQMTEAFPWDTAPRYRDAACFRPISDITTKQERIYRSTRTARRPVRYTCPPLARSSHSRKSVGCIIVTSARLELS